MHTNLQHLTSLEIISKNFNVPIEFLECMSECKYLSRITEKEILRTTELGQWIYQHPEIYIAKLLIPKKNKKRSHQFREVININAPFNNFYKELLFVFEKKIEENKQYYIHDNVHGFIRGKSILTNAKEHLNQKYILKIDIKDFFHSINKDQLINVFIKMGFNDEGATIFSNLCTYDGVLKEGFNTSPFLANLVCYDLDNDLIHLSKKYNLKYTRYSDDITFSSNEKSFPEIIEIKEILKKYNFDLNDDKTFLSSYGQTQYVTGLSISNDKYPRIPRQLKKRVRQKLYYLDKFPQDHFSNHKTINNLRKLYGNIIYILGIEKELGRKYKTKFLEILEKNNFKLHNIFKNAPRKFSNNVFHYIDETDIVFEKKKSYLAISVVSISDDDIKNTNIKKLELLKNELSIDFRNGLNESQKSKLFHYADDNIYVKEKYLSTLRELPIEAFIIYLTIENPTITKKEYAESYYKIFNLIMYNVLRRYKHNNNIIFVEENTKITINKLNENLQTIRGIPKFKLFSANKNEILLSLPDYILGIFRDCIKKDLSKSIEKLKEGQTLKEENKLNEILEKIRLVIDLTNSKYYARQSENKLNCIKLNQSIVTELQ